MKHFAIAAVILAVLLGGSLYNAWYAQSLTDSLSLRLDRAQELAQQNQWDQAGHITRQVYQDWQGHHFYLHTVMRHSDTDQILRSFRCVLQYLDLQEMDQYVAANADLIAQIQLLSEMEQASLVNVL